MNNDTNGQVMSNHNQRNRAGALEMTNDTSRLTSAPSPAKPRKAEIKNFQGLFEAIYRGFFKRNTLTKKEIENIASAPIMTSGEKNSILALVKTDDSLQRTKQALMLALLTESNLKIRMKLFLCDAIKQHPAFQSDYFSKLLYNSNCDDDDTQLLAIQEIQKINFSTLHFDNKQLRKKDYENYKQNAFHCILLFFAISGLPIIKITEYIQLYIVNNKKIKYVSNNKKINTIISSKDYSSFVIQYEILSNEIKTKSLQIENIAKIVNAKNNEIENMKKNIFDLEIKLKNKEEECNSLIDDVKKNRELYESEIIENRNKFVRLKGRVQRRLREEADFLENGLHALQRIPPKVDVMLDHAGRVIDGLRAEIEEVRGEG